jgi:hypothetical protein
MDGSTKVLSLQSWRNSLYSANSDFSFEAVLETISMRQALIRALSCSCLLGVLTLIGCNQAKPPTITTVEGTVLLDGKPLPNAQVEFQPNLPKFGAEYNSYATTDENGRFQLVCAHMQTPGAAIGKHRVLISEPPTPSELRGMDGDSQERYAKYVSGLQNRPIPSKFAAANTTPLNVDVTSDKKTYDFNLSRKD